MRNHVRTVVASVLCRVATGWKATRDLIIKNNVNVSWICYCPPLSRKRREIKSHSSVCLSVRHKNFNLGHNFCTITDRALILCMCVPCDKTFPVAPCRDLDGYLWPTSRSNLLPSGGPHFSEFACLLSITPPPLREGRREARGREVRGREGERSTPCLPPHVCIRAIKNLNLNLNYITTER